jgi:hypothetical protein
LLAGSSADLGCTRTVLGFRHTGPLLQNGRNGLWYTSSLIITTQVEASTAHTKLALALFRTLNPIKRNTVKNFLKYFTVHGFLTFLTFLIVVLYFDANCVGNYSYILVPT